MDPSPLHKLRHLTTIMGGCVGVGLVGGSVGGLMLDLPDSI